MILSLLVLFLQVSHSSPAPDLQRILQKKELRVVMHGEETEPFFFTHPQTHTLEGVDVWLAEQIAAKLRVKLRVVRGGKKFSEVLGYVSARSADMAISAIYPTLDRAQTYLFSDAYGKIEPRAILKRAKSKLNGSAEQVLDKIASESVSIGVYSSSVIASYFEKRFPKASPKVFKDRSTMIAALSSGEIAVAYIDELEERKWKQAIPHFELYFRSVADPAHSLPLVIAFHQKDTHLQYWTNLLIQQLKAERQLDEVINRYFSRGSK